MKSGLVNSQTTKRITMSIIIKQNAVGALLSEYQRTISDIQQTIKSISSGQLLEPVNPGSPESEFRSLQGILAHVVSSGYSYCVYIRSFKGIDGTRPPKQYRATAQEFITDLNDVMEYTSETFRNIYDYDLEETVETHKMKTAWGQTYDIEQLLEHAIVHILRHRRQIECLLQSKPHLVAQSQ
jgi:uncharacterized damage-inducible protein DinB